MVERDKSSKRPSGPCLLALFLLVLLLAGVARADGPLPPRPSQPAFLPPGPQEQRRAMGLVAAPFPGRAVPGRYFPLAAPGQEEREGVEKGGGPAGHPAWSIQRVDTPRIIQAMEDRSLALDAAGRPRVAYGGDFLYYAWFDGESWNVETVDDSGGVGNSADLALDAAGHPHIAYYDSLNAALKYAYHDGSAWHIQTVARGYVDYTMSIALDAAGHPHITYVDFFDFTDADLEYAYYDGSAWHIQVIEGTGWLGWQSSLALDAQGRPHVTYFCANQGNFYNDLRYAYLDGTTWVTTTVDTGAEMGGITGWYNSLALDSQGLPHVSYYDYDRAALRYAHFDGSRWISETVDNEGDPGWYGTSLALDAADHPHISYCPYGGWYNCGELRYAWSDGSMWRIQLVDASGAVGSLSSLALDKAGRPRISYYDDSHSYLKYAWYDGSDWHDMVVDWASNVGWVNSLKLDAADRPHISYYDRGGGPYIVNGNLKYAYYDGQKWRLSTVDDSTEVNGYNSLALDAAGRPHISYSIYSIGRHDYALKYTYYDGTRWQKETVDRGTGTIGDFNSLALDGAGRPHIAYYDGWNGTLKYAHYDGSAWITETVDAIVGGGAMTGQFPSLALDQAGLPHIVYLLFCCAYDLKYARYDGTQWQIETIETTWQDSGYTSLVLDSAGHPHVSYYIGSYGYVRYAYHDGERWHVEQVDSAAGSGWGGYTSLALDAAGRPHISYFDNNNYDLKYAYYDGTAWRIEAVDTAGWVGEFTSIALDAAGRPCISYFDRTNGDLKYACRDGGGYHVYLPAMGWGW